MLLIKSQAAHVGRAENTLLLGVFSDNAIIYIQFAKTLEVCYGVIAEDIPS